MIPVRKITYRISSSHKSVQETVATIPALAGAKERLLARARDREFDARHLDHSVEAEWWNGLKIKLYTVNQKEPAADAFLAALRREAERPVSAMGAIARLVLATCATTASQDEEGKRLDPATALDYIQRATRECYPEKGEDLIAHLTSWFSAAQEYAPKAPARRVQPKPAPTRAPDGLLKGAACLPLREDRLYIGDNGRVFCGAHAGNSATHTGRDISGQEIEELHDGDILDTGLTCEAKHVAPYPWEPSDAVKKAWADAFGKDGHA